MVDRSGMGCGVWRDDVVDNLLRHWLETDYAILGQQAETAQRSTSSEIKSKSAGKETTGESKSR